MIYVDNAATSYPKPQRVIDGVNYAINNYTSPNRGHYKSSNECTKLIFDTREIVAKFFGIKEAINVSFTQNATESINLVIDSLFDEKDHIITSVFEHNSVIRTLNSRNISYDTIMIDENYKIKYDELDKLIRQNTKAIFITHSSNILGNIVDLDVLSKFCKKHNLLLILDVAQSAGIIDINMNLQNIDILCFTGHKSLFGISGIGGIVVNDNFNKSLKNTKTGGTGYNSLSKIHGNMMPEVYEAGTANFVGIKALYEGISFINNIGIENIYTHENELMMYTFNELKKIDGIKIYGDFECIRTPVISFTFKDYDTNDLSDILAQKYDIATRSGFHCVSLLHECIGTQKTGLIRISFCYFNTIIDAKNVVDAIIDVCINN